MRIVRGRLANRRLTSPGGRVRPTSESVRDRWLTLLEPHLKGARVLDLFAGTGALGLEALSRGARSVDFVENGPAALHALKANVAALGVRDTTRIFKKDAIPFVEALEAGAYDIALADPPYMSGKLDRIIEAWRAVPFAHILSVEHAVTQELPERGRFVDIDDTRVTVLRARRGDASGRSGRPKEPATD
ncbi:MAG: RsmD family RNA methyltransferase [Gemmatimonadota bacterium]